MDVTITGQSLSDKEKKITLDLIYDLKTKLPPIMVESFSGLNLSLNIKNFSETMINSMPVVGAAHSHGLSIHYPFIRSLAASTDPLSVSTNTDGKLAHHHKTLYNLVLATMIHEMSHIYDNMNIQDPAFKAQYTQCQLNSISNSHTSSSHSIDDICQEILDIRTTVSSQIDYLTAANYRKSNLRLSNSYQQMNFLEPRSPDYYEWTNTKENFAVNMEYFLLDPDYQCRRPELYKALVHRFKGYIPFAASSCRSTPAALVLQEDKNDTRAVFENLEARRIYQVHYFHADGGADMASRFGHSMLRLVICAPERTTVSEACLEDVKYHRIISFRANVYDLRLNYSRAMNGGYSANLFILPLLSVIPEYTKKEFRNLFSLPLDLTKTDIENLVSNIISTHWAYRGKYKFLTNNCAHEILALLKRSLPQNDKLQRVFITTPNSLLEDLIKIGLLDSRWMNGIDEAYRIQTGFYFPSKIKHYHNAISILKRLDLSLANLSLEGYLALAPKTKKILIEKFLSMEDGADKKNVLLSLLLLEDLALAQARDVVRASAIEKILSLSEDSKNELAIVGKKSIQTTKSITDFFGTPSLLLDKKTGYGVPSNIEFYNFINGPEYTDIQKKQDSSVFNSLETMADEQARTKLLETQNNFNLVIQQNKLKIKQGDKQ